MDYYGNHEESYVDAMLHMSCEQNFAIGEEALLLDDRVKIKLDNSIQREALPAVGSITNNNQMKGKQYFCDNCDYLAKKKR